MSKTSTELTKKLTALSFGCSRLGKAVFEDTTDVAYEVLNKAWDLGIRSFDTATNYTYGDSEKILGKFLEGRESEILVSTKGGFKLTKKAENYQFLRPFLSLIRPLIKGRIKLRQKTTKRKNFDKDFLDGLLSKSVDRLGDNITFYQLHNPCKEVLQDPSYADFFKEMKEKYKIEKCGFALSEFDDFELCTYKDDVDIIQFPLSYREFKFEQYEKLKELSESGPILVGRTPFGRGLLTNQNKIKTGGESGLRDVDFSKKKDALCKKYGISDVQLALWFVKDLGVLDSVLFSSFNIDHLEENVRVFNSEIPDHFSWKEVIEFLES